ncbi:hypothetical protein Tco_0312280 [Tanacetum coccineum]
MKYHPQTYIPLRSILGVLQIGIKSQDLVMSNSEDSTVTYTAVSSPFESSTSPDYIPGPEEPELSPLSPEFVPEPEDEDEEEEEHPAPADSVPPPVHRVTARMSI